VAARLVPGETAELHVHLAVYEGGLDLYGFAEAADREVFLRLIGISGIGPKLGLSILSGMEPTDLLRAIAAADLARLVRINGVGKKTAERLVVELKDRCQEMLLARQATGSAATEQAVTEGGVLEDVRSALLNLGYKPPVIGRVLPLLAADAREGVRVEELLRAALRHLNQR
jgi:Holliday junction DNA helicase RuvA